MWRRLLLLCALGASAVFVLISIGPSVGKFLKSALLLAILLLWVRLAMLVWSRKPLRILVLVLPLTLAIPVLLPGRAMDPSELRREYVARLFEFEGTRYIWGGEGTRGIDCSGLPRRAFRDALLAYGFQHGNGTAIRSFLEQWWFDTSAKALGEGYRDFTIPVGSGGTIREMDYTPLLPGDLAVTTNGLHVIVYAGDGRWIQADPGIGAVATLRGREDENGWFLSPVTIHRWNLLQGP